MSSDEHMSPEISPSVGMRFMSNSAGRNKSAIVLLRTDYLILLSRQKSSTLTPSDFVPEV